MSKSDRRSKSEPVTPHDIATHPMASRGTRETIESIVIAIILAFLFRGFEAEAFVIPTGSMANTLKGRHLDVKCPECDHWYQTGASVEEKDGMKTSAVVVASTCPICRHTMAIDYEGKKNQRSFTGDRILVNKFAYELFEPQRWDIIVFKYPGNAKQNYIKRLVGLPNEAIKILHGDVYTLDSDELKELRDKGKTEEEIEDEFKIARKPPHKLKAMLQLVDDSRHISTKLAEIGWPSRWQSWPPADDGQLRSCAGDEEGFAIEAGADQESWLRYHHFIPTYNQWQRIRDGVDLPYLKNPRPRVISDFYGYNTIASQPHLAIPAGQCAFKEKGDSRLLVVDQQTRLDIEYDHTNPPARPTSLGHYWVGDLAIECRLRVESDSGELLLDLVEGGVRYICRIDLAEGHAVLSIEDGEDPRSSFVDKDGNQSSAQPTSKKAVVRGSGRYRLRFANVDNQLHLWVNERVIAFDAPTTFEPDYNVQPEFRAAGRPSDLQPAGIGAKGAKASISHLRILRDIYYTAVIHNEDMDYENQRSVKGIRDIMDDPLSLPGAAKRLFEDRKAEIFPLRKYIDVDKRGPIITIGPDHFFPMGDNSPASKDARLWSDRDPGVYPPPYVERKLLTGKAVFVYWPHSWRPFWPNFKRMRFIR